MALGDDSSHRLARGAAIRSLASAAVCSPSDFVRVQGAARALLVPRLLHHLFASCMVYAALACVACQRTQACSEGVAQARGCARGSLPGVRRNNTPTGNTGLRIAHVPTAAVAGCEYAGIGDTRAGCRRRGSGGGGR